MEGKRFVAIDVETTGVDAGNDEITELAAVPLGESEVWSSVIRTRSGMPSVQHHRAPEFAQVAAEYPALLAGGGVLAVSNNVEFDLRVIITQ